MYINVFTFVVSVLWPLSEGCVWLWRLCVTVWDVVDVHDMHGMEWNELELLLHLHIATGARRETWRPLWSEYLTNCPGLPWLVLSTIESREEISYITVLLLQLKLTICGECEKDRPASLYPPLTPGGGTLKVCALRLAGVYGEGEQRHLPRIVVRSATCKACIIGQHVPYIHTYVHAM